MTSFWNKLWRLKIQGKVKVFIWRLFYDYLPTARNLIKRGCKVEATYKVCGYDNETSLHTFIYCWWARAYWETLNINSDFLSLQITNTSDWIWYCFNTLCADDLVIFCYGARAIWYNRNLLVHEKCGLELEEACISTRALAAQYTNPNHKFVISEFEGSSKWLAPTKPFWKINCDRAREEGVESAGISGVCTNEEGMFMGVMVERVRGCQ
ncbi:hypothetical protein QQ045_032113 [Rhodiola kirilowii]